MLDQVTVFIVNYRTQELLHNCVESLLVAYPGVQLVLIDNGSGDLSTEYIEHLVETERNVSAILNRRNVGDGEGKLPAVGQRTHWFSDVLDLDPFDGPALPHEEVRRMLSGGNVGHGPALHLGFSLCKTPYAFTLDSDCVVLQNGFMGDMLWYMKQGAYAVGKIMLGTRREPLVPGERGKPNRHVHGSVAMWDLSQYWQLAGGDCPFVHHGLVSWLNMPLASDVGKVLVDYPIGDEDTAVHHIGRGSSWQDTGIHNWMHLPIMPQVFLEGLEFECVGGYFV